MHNDILIQGARVHNLRDISVRIPRNRLTVITGLSGSGKSSLAFDTLFAEGQRRYVESLSAYARQFLDQLGKPDVDHVIGLSPAIAIEQRSAAANPRSVVATTTEILDYLRLLYANAGQAHCPECQRPVGRSSAEQIVEKLLALPHGTRLTLLAPLARRRRGRITQLLRSARVAGYVRVRVDGELYDLDDPPKVDPAEEHTVEAVIDRLIIKDDLRRRLTDSVELALEHGQGILTVLWQSPDSATVHEELLSEKNICADCGLAFDELKSNHFSFNSPAGACPTCDGLGMELYFDTTLIVPDPTRPLLEGAIDAWRRGPKRLVGAYNLLLKSLATHAEVDPETPWCDLPQEFRNLVLHGSGEEELVLGQMVRGSYRRRKKVFEGVLPNLERRLVETASDSVRKLLRTYMGRRRCSACDGRRLRPESLASLVAGHGLMDLLAMPISQARGIVETLPLSEAQLAIVGQVVNEIARRLTFLDNVGLGYLTLDRESATLSGGEMQRIRLATQIGSALVGVLYVLDEPTIGLHPRDTERLIAMLRELQGSGNTVVVVEHDITMIREADHVIDLGPGAGRHGGEVVYEGTVAGLLRERKSLTGLFLAGREEIPVPSRRQPPGELELVVEGATANNLKDITVSFPLGCLIAVTGVSGSGKSTLVNDVLRRHVEQRLAKARRNSLPVMAGECKAVTGLENIDKIIVIDQSPIGRTPRSNAVTYTGAFGEIRSLFAATPAAKARGYGPGRFSFNVKGGRCEVCKGDGLIKLEMHFLPDVYTVCEQCGGLRYNRETLEVKYGGHSISDVLTMTVDEACEVFAAIPKLVRSLGTLAEVGLGYLQLGQSATTLSGGEAQRVKLAAELQRPGGGHTLYLLDEPTTGLHFADTRRLLEVLLRLREKGHTVIVIEHNLDVLKVADHIIDLGPEGGVEGGHVVATGTPEAIAKAAGSYTGQYLQQVLKS